MKTKNQTAAPALPSVAPAISHSSVKPERNTGKAEDPDQLRLLKQIVEETRSFCRPDGQERQDAEK